MTDKEAHLKLALNAVRQAAQQPQAAEITSTRLVGAALLCIWAAANLLTEAASLKEIRALLRR